MLKIKYESSDEHTVKATELLPVFGLGSIDRGVGSKVGKKICRETKPHKNWHPSKSVKIKRS
jgi:hypothetical protein